MADKSTPVDLLLPFQPLPIQLILARSRERKIIHAQTGQIMKKVRTLAEIHAEIILIGLQDHFCA